MTELREYEVGDLIKSEGFIYLVVEHAGEYAIVDLDSNNVSRLFKSLQELYRNVHSTDDQLVHGEVVVRRCDYGV
ncbi:hypothetical protein [Levilactobacillus sp. HBUAS67488]